MAEVEEGERGGLIAREGGGDSGGPKGEEGGSGKQKEGKLIGREREGEGGDCERR